MSPFIVLMILGLAGLCLMAIPAFGRHGGHAGTGHVTGGAAHAANIGHAGASHGYLGGAAARLAAGVKQGANAAKTQAGKEALAGSPRFMPSPRAIFSVLALFGAFGNVFDQKFHLAFAVAAILAAIPALLLERYMVTPFWNLLFSFQSKPCSPLEDLIFSDAEAVTPFRNGKGIVSLVRDGRMVQLTAHLPPAQSAMPVKVGDILQVEDVDAAGELLTVSVK